MESGMPTPPMEEYAKSSAPPRRTTVSTIKSVKPIHKSAKRSAQHVTRSPVDYSPVSPHAMDSRHKRCDGEFPCKRCKDDGLVCTAGTRKKTEYKQLPRGYAEVLENTQFALIATVHKLYAMVRNGQSWDLGEPELNDRSQPVIHDIATKLGCIRPNADVDLPPHSVFPEDEAGLAKLAAELEVQQKERERQAVEQRSETDSNCNRTERASSSELDPSDFEQDYRKAFVNGQNLQTMSPQSFTSYNGFETKPIPPEMDSSVLFPVQSPSTQTPFPAWNMNRLGSMSMSQYMPQMDLDLAEMMLSQGVVESEFGTIKPHILSCSQPEALASGFDPMIYSGYGMESLRS
ncbi:hypothetical protein DL770_006172 [Monosporascus sp. CRB-9-2]|nr:hypothetical protein DL770_006172 [Monosporascus sp. CRB-9-2]